MSSTRKYLLRSLHNTQSSNIVGNIPIVHIKRVNIVELSNKYFSFKRNEKRYSLEEQLILFDSNKTTSQIYSNNVIDLE